MGARDWRITLDLPLQAARQAAEAAAHQKVVADLHDTHKKKSTTAEALRRGQLFAAKLQADQVATEAKERAAVEAAAAEAKAAAGLKAAWDAEAKAVQDAAREAQGYGTSALLAGLSHAVHIAAMRTHVEHTAEEASPRTGLRNFRSDVPPHRLIPVKRGVWPTSPPPTARNLPPPRPVSSTSALHPSSALLTPAWKALRRGQLHREQQVARRMEALATGAQTQRTLAHIAHEAHTEAPNTCVCLHA